MNSWLDSIQFVRISAILFPSDSLSVPSFSYTATQYFLTLSYKTSSRNKAIILFYKFLDLFVSRHKNHLLYKKYFSQPSNFYITIFPKKANFFSKQLFLKQLKILIYFLYLHIQQDQGDLKIWNKNMMAKKFTIKHILTFLLYFSLF